MMHERPVTFLLPALDPGGAERKTVALANGFAARGIPVEICTFWRDDGLLRGELAPTVRVTSLCLRRARHFVAPLKAYLRRAQPRILVCIMHNAAVFGTVARVLGFTAAPVVILEGGMAASTTRPGWSLRRRRIVTLLLYRFARAIIANAAAIAEEIRRDARLPRGRVIVLPNPSGLAPLHDDGTAPEHRWPARYPAICTVARLDSHKDVATLLRAFAILRRSRPLSLVVLGDGPERDPLERLAQMLGIKDDVHFLGWQAQPWRLVRHARVFALSSRSEGFSNALVEAMAVGCPPVVTDVPGANRQLLNDGALGRLVPPGNPQAMAEGIAAMLDDPVPTPALIAQAQRLGEAPLAALLDAIWAQA